MQTSKPENNHQAEEPKSKGTKENGSSVPINLSTSVRLFPATTQLPQTEEAAEVMRNGSTRKQDEAGLRSFQRQSRLLMAAIAPGTFTVRYANDYFCRLTGIGETAKDLTGKEVRLLDLFPDLRDSAAGFLYRRHLLHLVLRDIYQLKLSNLRLLDEPVIAPLKSPLYPEPRLIELWLRSEQLRVVRVNPEVDEFADLDLPHLASREGRERLIDPYELEVWGQRLCLENYRIEGLLLMEGVEVTEREVIRHIVQLLIDRDSILRPQKFKEINKQMRSLFRATNSLILTAENDQARLFVGGEGEELRATIYSIHSLVGSQFLRAAEANRIWNVPDLADACLTDCERALLNKGVRSMLLVPLVVQPMNSPLNQQLAGVVGVVSKQPYHFDGVDSQHAKELIPAFTSALRQAIQHRFTNIHPAVEWRFLQEAERRSWGMTPEPIVFTNVYPLYGISDIRGSSEERNRAIQADLLEQFRLALGVVEAVCQFQETSLGEQLKLDVQAHIEQIQQKVTVDAEVTVLKYLSDRVEIYFDYFAECGQVAQDAVTAYRNACTNDHKSVYVARARYDQTINQINSLLKETWDKWQIRMQQVIPHYCDIEATDGINHMIYVGEAIDPKFCTFHLRSLRYEQMRAICDCARTAFSLQSRYGTTLKVTHLVLVQDLTVDIFHDESTEKLFDVRGTRDIRYEIVKKRIDKAVDEHTQTRITQPGMLTVVYSTEEEWAEYQQYCRYLAREGWVDSKLETGTVEPLQGITGLKFARVRVLPAADGEES